MSMTNVKNRKNILDTAVSQLLTPDFQYIFEKIHISHTHFAVAGFFSVLLGLTFAKMGRLYTKFYQCLYLIHCRHYL